MSEEKKPTEITEEQLRTELRRVNSRTRFLQLLMNSVYTLIVVAASAVLVAVIFLPVLRIYGYSAQGHSSMLVADVAPFTSNHTVGSK